MESRRANARVLCLTSCSTLIGVGRRGLSCSSSRLCISGPRPTVTRPGDCDAVARRARAVPTEYATKARNTDQRYCGTPEGKLGPVSHQLQTYDRVRALVFGPWAEASLDAEQLLGTLARKGAAHHWRALGCQSEAAAVGTLAWLLRRRWGITALRENARLKLERLTYVGRGAAVAASRRLQAASYHAARAGRAIGRHNTWRGSR